MEVFECQVRRGQVVPGTLKQNPQASLRVSEALLKDIPDGHIYAIKLRYEKESYAILKLDCAIKDGDLVVCGAGRPGELMRADWQPKGKLWHLCPVRGDRRHVWPQPDLYAVFGKVVKVIDDVEQFRTED